MLVYKQKTFIEFGALTLVDGPFFSIYPYNDNYTLSHVTYTPIEKYNKPPQTYYNEHCCNIEDIKNKMENDVIRYYPEFFDTFEYIQPIYSIKAKRNIMCDDRTPVINTDNNIISCYTGKIQGIFYIENYINNILL